MLNFKGSLMDLFANSRVSWKVSHSKNTIVYLSRALVMKNKKSFIRLSAGLTSWNLKKNLCRVSKNSTTVPQSIQALITTTNVKFNLHWRFCKLKISCVFRGYTSAEIVKINRINEHVNAPNLCLNYIIAKIVLS